MDPNNIGKSTYYSFERHNFFSFSYIECIHPEQQFKSNTYVFPHFRISIHNFNSQWTNNFVYFINISIYFLFSFLFLLKKILKKYSILKTKSIISIIIKKTNFSQLFKNISLTIFQKYTPWYTTFWKNKTPQNTKLIAMITAQIVMFYRNQP